MEDRVSLKLDGVDALGCWLDDALGAGDSPVMLCLPLKTSLTEDDI